MPAPNEHRIRHKAEELTKRHFRATVETVDTLFRTAGFDLLSIGGPGHEIPEFVELLPRHLRDRIAGTFSLDDHPAKAAHIRQRAMAILREHEHREQRRVVADVVESVAARGRAALGLEDCLWAGTLAAIDRLVIEEGAVMPGVACDHCGWMSVRGAICAYCGLDVRPVADILDELTQVVINEDGSINHVKVPTELRKHLVGAMLRFHLPPRPETGVSEPVGPPRGNRTRPDNI